jgi:glucose/mannose-6-phosphate isomerase
MNLDDFSSFPRIDTRNMLAEINRLPDELLAAWELGLTLPLPRWEGIQQVLIAGMGGSATGGDLLSAYLEPSCPAPVFIHRDYHLPAWAQGPQTLVIAASHSGETEETISAFERARAGGCRCLALTTGGRLAALASEAGIPTWPSASAGQTQAAVGSSFGLLLAAFTRLGLAADPSAELSRALAALRAQQAQIRAEVPVVHNPAKRMAGQLMGRWVAVIASGVLAPVARRYKIQLNELAKTWGQIDLLPEADHTTLAGLLLPEDQLGRTMVLFLRAPFDHPRSRRRSDLTRQVFMLEGLNTDFIDAGGDSSLANQWTALHFGDYMAYYLAIACEVDPAPAPLIEEFKQEMQSAG